MDPNRFFGITKSRLAFILVFNEIETGLIIKVIDDQNNVLILILDDDKKEIKLCFTTMNLYFPYTYIFPKIEIINKGRSKLDLTLYDDIKLPCLESSMYWITHDKQFNEINSKAKTYVSNIKKSDLQDPYKACKMKELENDIYLFMIQLYLSYE